MTQWDMDINGKHVIKSSLFCDYNHNIEPSF